MTEGSTETADGVIRVLLVMGAQGSLAGAKPYLSQSGMEVTHVQSEWEAVVAVIASQWDVVVFANDDERAESLGFVRWITAYRVGLIVVGSPIDVLGGEPWLDGGADDHMLGPISMGELVARIRSVRRRRTGGKAAMRPLAPLAAAPSVAASGTVKVSCLTVDFRRRMVFDPSQKALHLTSAEFEVLRMLIDANGAAVSRDSLSRGALGRPWQRQDRSIDQLVYSLLRKFPRDEHGYAVIQAERKVGYRMLEAQSVDGLDAGLAVERISVSASIAGMAVIKQLVGSVAH